MKLEATMKHTKKQKQVRSHEQTTSTSPQDTNLLENINLNVKLMHKSTETHR